MTPPGPVWYRSLLGLGLVGLGTACGGEAPEVDHPTGQSGRDRAAFTAWLASSPVSPLKAIALIRVDSTVSLGPATSDVPLEGMELARLVPGRGNYLLEIAGERRTVHKHRPFPLGEVTVLIGGSAGHDVVTVFGQTTRGEATFYPPDPRWSFDVTLERDKKHSMRLLALDGIEVEGTHVGTVTVPLGREAAQLEVRSVPDPSTEESDLVIYFRDETNGQGSYPSGRFVTLTPMGGDGATYHLDFNSARNPFCAYSTVYPCPVPWPGNSVPAAIEAGERYENSEY